MMMKVLAAVALCAVSTQAVAADWWLIEVGSHKPKRTVIMMDKESIRSGVGDTLRVWSQVYYEDQSDGIMIMKFQDEFDCKQQTSKQISFISYRINGDVAKSETPAYYLQRAQPLAPDTIGETELHFVCGAKTDAFDVGAIADFSEAGRRIIRALDSPPKQ